MEEVIQIMRAMELCDRLIVDLEDDIAEVPQFLRGQPGDRYMEATQIALDNVKELRKNLQALYYEKNM